MKRLFNTVAWIIVFIVLSWFYSCMKRDTERLRALKEKPKTPAELRVTKVCGSLNNIKVRGPKVFCANGQPVEGVNGYDLKTPE